MQNFYYLTKLLNIKKKYFIPFTIFEGQFDLLKYKKKKEKKILKNLKYNSLQSIFNLKNFYKDISEFNYFHNKKNIKKKWYKNNYVNHL
jgi:hypothetical protein